MTLLRALIDLTLRQWLWLALIASAAMLAIAHAFQTFGGLQPCHLCLQQRTAYWVAIGVAAIGLIMERTPDLKRYAIFAGWLLAIVFLIGAGIAIRHAGAEWKFWPAPEGCSGARLATSADIARLLKGGKFARPRCDVAPWRFLWLSMAGWNALISLKLAGWSAAWALWRRDHAA